MNSRLIGFMIAGFLASEICIRLFGIESTAIALLVLMLAFFVYMHVRNRRTL